MATKDTKITSFRLPPELVGRFKRAAEADRRTMTLALTMLIERYCEQIEAEQGERKAAA